MRAARRVESWSLPHRQGIEAVEPGLRRIYREGRQRRGRAARGKGPKGRAMHQWRKRVKELRYAAEMLDRSDPGGDREPAIKRGGRKRRRAGQRKAAEHIRRLARRADELGELLGEDHDLALLEARLRASGQPGEGSRSEIGRGTRTMLLKQIARRRALLRGERCAGASVCTGAAPSSSCVASTWRSRARRARDPVRSADGEDRERPLALGQRRSRRARRGPSRAAQPRPATRPTDGPPPGRRRAS